MLTPGSATCQCTICDLYFKSDAAFMKHRVSVNPKQPRGADRRCLTTGEMRDCGMAQNAKGQWTTRLMTEEEQARTKGKEAVLA